MIKRLFGSLTFCVVVTAICGSSAIYAQTANSHSPAIPPGFIVDQCTDETIGNHSIGANSIPFYSPIGQEFVPDHSKLVAVDVCVWDFGGGDGTLRLTIHDGDIYGPILASGDFAVTARYYGWRYVTFQPPVILNPGSLYVIQVETVGSTGNWGIVSRGGCWEDLYPRGDRILQGRHEPFCHVDLDFRTYALKAHDGQDDNNGHQQR